MGKQWMKKNEVTVSKRVCVCACAWHLYGHNKVWQQIESVIKNPLMDYLMRAYTFIKNIFQTPLKFCSVFFNIFSCGTFNTKHINLFRLKACSKCHTHTKTFAWTLVFPQNIELKENCSTIAAVLWSFTILMVIDFTMQLSLIELE